MEKFKNFDLKILCFIGLRPWSGHSSQFSIYNIYYILYTIDQNFYADADFMADQTRERKHWLRPPSWIYKNLSL
jgi:hypothetical protein